jgi:phosphotransferase system HPr-like phosphotransfer protein
MSVDFLTLFQAVDEQKIITEEEFGHIIQPFARPFLSLSGYVHEGAVGENQALWHMGFLANVIKHASDVEHFLDLYRARNNRNWICFRELTATIKNFAKAGFLLEEIKKSVKPELLFPDEETRFVARMEESTRFLSVIITRSFLELRREAKRLALPVPSERELSTHRSDLPGEIILPHTIEEASTSGMALTARKIASRFADVAEKIRPLEEVVRFQGPKLETVIPYKVNEGRLRELGTRLHNLQSWYDTYVSNHSIEGEYPALKGLRSILPCQLNLCKIATILSHYYERHLLVSSLITEKLEEIVPSSRLLEELCHFDLFYLMRLFHTGRRLSESLVNAMVEIVTYELPVAKDLGFHARPSTRVAKVVRRYGADVRMLVDDQVFDASSILDLLSAGGYILTKRLDRVKFRGDKRALDDLKLLAEFNYGETRDGKDIPLPEALSYLY